MGLEVLCVLIILLDRKNAGPRLHRIPKSTKSFFDLGYQPYRVLSGGIVLVLFQRNSEVENRRKKIYQMLVACRYALLKVDLDSALFSSAEYSLF